jgi:hypothetical protein
MRAATARGGWVALAEVVEGGLGLAGAAEHAGGEEAFGERAAALEGAEVFVGVASVLDEGFGARVGVEGVVLKDGGDGFAGRAG